MPNQKISAKAESMKFKHGDKVTIEPHIWWPDGGVGIVSLPPELVTAALEAEAEFSGIQRTFAANSNITTSVWVEFDEPTMDCSDDGPYTSGEVGLEFLSHIHVKI